MFAFLLLLLALATYGGIAVDAQGEAQVIEVFQEADAVPSPEEVKIEIKIGLNQSSEFLNN